MNTSQIPFSPGSSIVAYLRDSGGSEQDLSIGQQQDALRTWAANNDVLITTWFIDEARSGGSTSGRENFIRMIDYFRRPSIPECGLVLWSFSRFARDINDSMYYKSDLRRRGFKIHALQDPIPDGSNGILFEAIVDWKNDRYLEDLSNDSKRGQHHLIQNYGALGGFPPLGYKREEIDLGTYKSGKPHIVARWVPDFEVWEKCQLAWHMRAVGKTYHEIGEVTGLKRSTGGWSSFFRNEIYLGVMNFSDDVRIEGYVTPMIDQKTWEQVQARHYITQKMQSGNNPDHPRRLGSSFLLSGLLYCVRCGSPMNGNVVHFNQGKWKKYSYDYYLCSRVGRYHDCNAIRIPKEPLEQAVFDAMNQFILDPDGAAARQEEFISELEESNNEVNLRKQTLKNELDQIAKKKKNLVDALAETGAQSRSVMTAITDLEQKESEYKRELLDLLSISTKLSNTITPDSARCLAAKQKEYFESMERDKMKEIMRGLICRIFAEKDGQLVRGIIEFYSPGAALLGDKKKDNFMSMVSAPPGAPVHTHKIYYYNFTVSLRKKKK